jgi:hypothetical protein
MRSLKKQLSSLTSWLELGDLPADPTTLKHTSRLTQPKKIKKTNQKQKTSSFPSPSLLVFCFVRIMHPHRHTHNQNTFTLVFSYFLMYPSTLLSIHDLYLQITVLLSLSTKTPENTQTSFYCLPSFLVL